MKILKPKLSLSNTLEQNKIAYFHLNTNGYGGVARTLGKMILQHLKVISKPNSVRTKDFNQIIGNKIYKILFRQGVVDELEVWSKLVRTLKGNKKTYQLKEVEDKEKMIGLESLRSFKEMRIEFDFLKKLSQRKEISIDKNKHKENLFLVWRDLL